MWRGAEATSHRDASSWEPVFHARMSPQVAAAPAEPVSQTPPYSCEAIPQLLTLTNVRTLSSVSLLTVGHSGGPK